MQPLVRRALYVFSRLRTRSSFRLAGGRFEVPPGVLNPTRFRASLLFARACLFHAPGRPARVLELGCGCGAAAVLLARAGHAVTAVDLDPAAAASCARNAALNGTRLAACVSDWDAALAPGARFDFVVTNPPFLPDEPPAQRLALYGGPRLEATGAALRAVSRRLAPRGRALLLTSERSGRAHVEQLVQAAGLRPVASLVARALFEDYRLDLLAAAEP